MSRPSTTARLRSLTAASLIVLATLAHGKGVQIGEQAPPLKIKTWVQGEPIKEFQRGTVYVVNFLSSAGSMSADEAKHTDRLHEEFKQHGVVFLGLDSWIMPPSTPEAFVKKMGEGLSYRFAVPESVATPADQPEVSWFDREFTRINYAMVVDQLGRVVWMDTAATLDSDVLRGIIQGTYDLEKAKTRAQRLREASALAFKIPPSIAEPMEKKDWAQTMVAIDQLEKEKPELAAACVITRYFIAALAQDESGLVAVVRRFLQDPDLVIREDLAVAAALISGLAKAPSPESLAVARQAAALALERGASKDPTALAILARLQFQCGNREGAIATQRQAVLLAPAPENLDLGKYLTLDQWLSFQWTTIFSNETPEVMKNIQAEARRELKMKLERGLAAFEGGWLAESLW